METKNDSTVEMPQKLESLDFKKIESTNLYTRDCFLIEANKEGPPYFYVDFFRGNSDVTSIRNIMIDEFYGQPSIVTLERAEDGSDLFRVDNFASRVTSIGKEGPFVVVEHLDKTEHNKRYYFHNVSLEDQLKKSGFVKQGGTESVFRQELEYKDGAEEIIVILSDGKIQKIARPIRERVARQLTPNLKIVDYNPDVSAKPSEEMFGKQPQLEVENNYMRFRIYGDPFGGGIVRGSQRLLREVTLEELGLVPFEVTEEESGFKIGGVNSTELIKSLTKLRGQSIGRLQKEMRLKSLLRKDERLLEVLAADNDLVLSLGLTHQDLARPLQYARTIYLNGLGKKFTYRGRRFEIETHSYRGFAYSPFGDGKKSHLDIVVTNLGSGKSLACSTWVADTIEKYGFYNQYGSRLEPQDITEVFDLL